MVGPPRGRTHRVEARGQDFLAVFFAVLFFAGDFFAVLFLAVLFVAVLFFAGDFLAVLFFAGDFFAVLFFAGDFLAVLYVAGDFFAVLFFAGARLAAVFLVDLVDVAYFAPARAPVAAPAAAAGATFASFFAPDTTSLKVLAGRNFGTEVALIFTTAPVCGLRPVRALRTCFSNTPKPVMATFSPAATARVMVSSTASTALFAARLSAPSRSAIASMSSALFTCILRLLTDGGMRHKCLERPERRCQRANLGAHASYYNNYRKGFS